MQEHVIRCNVVVRIGNAIDYLINQLGAALGLHDNG